MKFLVKKHFGKLVPVYNSDAEALKDAKLKEGKTYEVEIVHKRNIDFHKKYFSLLNLCYQNQEHFEMFEDLREYLTIKSGYYRKVLMPSGYEQIKAKSISFASMDNIEFEKLYHATIDVICQFLGAEKDEILEEVINYM